MGPLSEDGGSGSMGPWDHCQRRVGLGPWDMGPLSEEGGSGSVGPLLEEGEPTVRRGISLASELIFVLLWR